MISIIDPPAWHQQAACRGSNPAAFYPEVGQWTVSAKAIAICETCPVAQPCREAGADEVAWDTKACAFYNDSERPQVVDHDAQAQSTPEIDEF